MIQEQFLKSGKTHSIKASYYDLSDTNYKEYFGNISPPHFSLLPYEKLHKKISHYDEVNMWIWENAKPLILNKPVNVFPKELFVFPKDVLIEKLKRYYMEFLYYIIDVYPSHNNSYEMKHVAVHSILNSLINLYKFCYLAEKRAFSYTEKLLTHIKTTKIYN